MCDEIIKSYDEEIKTVPTNFNEKNIMYKIILFWQYKLKMKVKDASIKNRTQQFFDDINIKDFDPNNIKVDEKSYENILIYYIGYLTIKKDQKNYSVNPLYLIFSKLNGQFEEINLNKYLTLNSTN